MNGRSSIRGPKAAAHHQKTYGEEPLTVQPGSAQSVRMLNTKPENLGVVEVVVVVGENNNKQKKSLEEAVKGAVGTTSSNT
jgi:hypothetical protein